MIYCTSCLETFDATSLFNYTPDYIGDPYDIRQYSLYKCPKCQEPILQMRLLEDDENSSDFYWGQAKQLYPILEFRITNSVPKPLARALEESIKCYKSEAYGASIVMCRRTLDGLCKLNSVDGQNLSMAIDELRNRGVIDQRLYEWASELRLIGNSAAHDNNFEFSSIDARESLDFTIAILDYIYTYKDKFERFKNRRTR